MTPHHLHSTTPNYSPASLKYMHEKIVREKRMHVDESDALTIMSGKGKERRTSNRKRKEKLVNCTILTLNG